MIGSSILPQTALMPIRAWLSGTTSLKLTAVPTLTGLLARIASLCPFDHSVESAREIRNGGWVRAPDLKEVRIHDLSHSFASRALALGEGLPMIGKAAWSHTGADDRQVHTPRPRHREGICRSHWRQHRQRPGRCVALRYAHMEPHSIQNAATGLSDRSEWCIIPPPLTERISDENLYRVEIYNSFPGISVRIPAFSNSVIKANADFFKLLTIPECPRRHLAIFGRKRRVDAACHPRRHGHRFRRRDPFL